MSNGDMVDAANSVDTVVSKKGRHGQYYGRRMSIQ